MRELLDRTGESRATLYHWLEQGLLPEPHRPNKRMAYYDPDCVGRAKLIRKLKEERFLPLRTIKKVLDRGVDREFAEVDARMLEVLGGQVTDRALVVEKYPMSDEVYADLGRAGLIPDRGPLTADEVAIVGAVCAMRRAGLDEDLGFEVMQLGMYRTLLDGLIDAEFATFNDKVVGTATPDRVATLATAAVEGISELLAALHRRLLRQRLTTSLKGES